MEPKCHDVNLEQLMPLLPTAHGSPTATAGQAGFVRYPC